MSGGFMLDPDEPISEEEALEERDPPAPVKPLLLGFAASFAVYLLWTAIGMPLVGIVGGIFCGIAIVALLLWRARPRPPIDEDETTRERT